MSDRPEPYPEDFDLSDEEQRLALINRRAFERAVTKATEQATQNVSQVHRRRLVLHTAIVTIVIMAALGVAIIVFISNNNGAQAQDNSKFNCQLFTHVSEDMAQFVTTDANLRTSQQLNQAKISKLHAGALKALFQDPETTRLSKQSQIADKDTTHFWKAFLVPDLKKIASVNCARKLG